MTIFTYGEGGGLSHFEVKATAGSADFSGALVITSAGLVSVNGAITFAAAETHKGNNTFQTGTLAISGPTTVGTTLSFSGVLVCTMSSPVTVTAAPGQTLIFSRRLVINDGGGNTIYLYGGTSAQ